MNIFYAAYCRTFQAALHLALPLLPYRNPQILKRTGEIPGVIRNRGVKKPLIITDKNLSRLGKAEPLKKALEDSGVAYGFFDGAYPNPTSALAEEACDFYVQNGCDSLIAFGGGSPMDLAKAVGVMLVKPGKPLRKMSGILKVRKRLPLLIAIPTTVGTGSETTLAAVIIDSETRHKFAINDFPLIPSYAVLDRETVHGLPPSLVAETGIDALTHAVEAYIGCGATKETGSWAEEAVSLIFKNIEAAAQGCPDAEEAMLRASHLAGRAFTRSYVGYIHAVSHSLSGRYNLPHGRTNATLLPIVLEMYGEKVWKKLDALSAGCGFYDCTAGAQANAKKFISEVKRLNAKFGIPEKIAEIKEADIPLLSKYADREANPLYPVPVLWDSTQLERIYRKAMVKNGSKRNSNLG